MFVKVAPGDTPYLAGPICTNLSEETAERRDSGGWDYWILFNVHV